jgi:hypothetical protein
MQQIKKVIMVQLEIFIDTLESLEPLDVKIFDDINFAYHRIISIP